MCTFNGARYLNEQLQSIAAQTRPPDELIICDDLSADDTAEIVERFATRASFPVRLIRNPQRLGSTKNFEKAMQSCSGELIALADQDDVWEAEKLARLEAEFQRQPKTGLIFSDAEIVDDELRPTGRRMWAEVGFGEREKRLVRQGRALEVLLPGWSVTGATLALRSRFRELAFPIPTNLSMIHDGWLALVIAAVTDVDFIDQPLIKYRQHAAQQIGAPERAARAGRPVLKSMDALQAAMRAETSYESLIEIGERVRQRLASRCGQFECGNALSRLDQRLLHLRTRAGMPANALSRLPTVLRELFAGRYHRYSTGFRSAAKDFVRRPSAGHATADLIQTSPIQKN